MSVQQMINQCHCADTRPSSAVGWWYRVEQIKRRHM